MFRTYLVALAVVLVFVWSCFMPVRPVPHCWPMDGSAAAIPERG